MEEPSGTQRPINSAETEEPEESKVNTEIPESTDNGTTQDMAEPSGTYISKISVETQTEPGTEIQVTTKETQSVGTQTDEITPLDRNTGALVPPHYFSLYAYLGQCWPFRYFQASQTGEEQPGADGNKDDESIDESYEVLTGADGNPDDVDTIVCKGADGHQDDMNTDVCNGAAGNQDVVTIDVSKAPDDHDVIKVKSFKENIDKIREIIESTYSMITWYVSSYHKVGIFSRSSESDYEWLIKQLKSEPFHSTVSSVRPYYISNSGMHEFMDALSQCTFGILYHTKNRGRINITDVTDSLYDEELNYMSLCLRKENVIVIVDDLEDTSDTEKTRILENQPSIKRLARDILLFNATEKHEL